MQLVSRASTESRWTEVIDGSRSDSLRELAICVRPQCYACIRSYLTDMAITHCISLGYDYHSSHVGVSLYRGPRCMLTGPFPYSYGEDTRIRYNVPSIPPDLSTTSDRTSLDVVPFAIIHMHRVFFCSSSNISNHCIFWLAQILSGSPKDCSCLKYAKLEYRHSVRICASKHNE